MKRLTYLLIVVISIFLACGQAEQKAEQKVEEEEMAAEQAVEEETDWRLSVPEPEFGSIQRDKNPVVVMETNHGNIEIELYWKEAPKNAENFLYLVDKGFYDGLTFHRLVPGFVIQGGDPLGNGTGGPGYRLPQEPVVKNHQRGAIAMAKSALGTNASQFYICLTTERTAPLDQQNFVVFGHVVNGMDVVDKIAQVPTGAQDFPQNKVEIIKAYEKE